MMARLSSAGQVPCDGNSEAHYKVPVEKISPGSGDTDP